LIPKSQYLTDLPDTAVTELIAAIQRERLTVYLNATATDSEALAFYQFNELVSSQLFGLVAAFEVVLRNKVSNAIIQHFNREDWYRARSFISLLAGERRANLREVRKRLKTQGQKERSGRIVASLTFHFWGALHEGKYRDTLWTPFLRTIWTDGTNVKKLHRDLIKIRDLRNRLAHHEPVFAYKWRKRIPVLWQRLEELSPPKHAWLKDRIGSALNTNLVILDSIDLL